MQRVEDVIVARYREALSLSDIAREVGRDGSYLSALFRRARGRTITSYITELRVRHAESLLAWDSMSVLEIAAASGFGSVSRFYEAFVKVTGRRPRDGTGRAGRPGEAGRGAVPPPPVFLLHAVWVDEQPENNIRERRMLGAMGVAVDCYVTGKQGLRALEHGGYSLVISDIRRQSDKDPQHADSGWEFARQVKARYPKLPLLFYCGYSDPGRRQRAKEVGAAGLFTYESELVEAVARTLREEIAGRKEAGQSPQKAGGSRRGNRG